MGAKFYSRDGWPIKLRRVRNYVEFFFFFFFLSGITSCPESRRVRNYIAFYFILFYLFLFLELRCVWNYIVSGITSCPELRCVWNYVVSGITSSPELRRVRNYVVSGITLRFFFFSSLFDSGSPM